MDLFCDLHRIAITEARSWWFFERCVMRGGQRKPGTVAGLLFLIDLIEDIMT